MKLYYNKYSKTGKFLYDLCFKGAIFLNKHKWFYYILLFTWGLLMSLIGLIVSLFLLIGAQKPYGIFGLWKFEVKERWGGCSLGCMFIRDTTSAESIDRHEIGHTYQNAILGPFFLFIVAIPSAIRYWYQYFKTKREEGVKPYDAIWFEGSATDIGDEDV